MSLAHILLSNIKTVGDIVEIDVQSTDFNDAREWQTIGHVVADLTRMDYEFFPLNAWKDIRVVPPKAYQLKGRELEALLTTKYVGYHWGAWSGRINSMVMRMLSQRSPDYSK